MERITPNTPGFNPRVYFEKIRPFVEKRRTQTYTATILSFLAIALFGWYAVRPTIATIIYLRREITDKTLVNQKMEEKIAALIEAQAVYQTAEPQLPLIKSALPDTPDATELLAQLTRLASSTGASMSAVRIPTVPLAAVDLPNAKKSTSKKQVNYQTTILVAGDFPAIKSFLDGIIKLRRVLTIDSINVGPTKDEKSDSGLPGSSPLRLTLKVNSYYLTN